MRPTKQHLKSGSMTGLLVVCCLLFTAERSGRAQAGASVSTDLYLIFYQYGIDENGELDRDREYPSVMRLDGTVVVEDLAGYYPPVEPDIWLRRFNYSFSGNWIVAETYGLREDDNMGRVFLIQEQGDAAIQLNDDRVDAGLAQWSPGDDLLAYGTMRDLEGYWYMSFLDPADPESSRDVQLGDGTPYALNKVYSFAWSPDGAQLYFSTLENRRPEPAIVTRLTIGLQGQAARILYQSEESEVFPDGLTIQWVFDGIITYCDWPSDLRRLCAIDPQTGAWQEFFSFSAPEAYGEGLGRSGISSFAFAPNDGTMLFSWFAEQMEQNGGRRVNTGISSWDRQTGESLLLLEGNIGSGALQVTSYIPPDILDGTRPRWAERAEATVAAPGG